MTTIELADLELEGEMGFGKCVDMVNALESAIGAMAHNGSENEHLETISIMLTAAKVSQAKALERHIAKEKASAS